MIGVIQSSKYFITDGTPPDPGDNPSVVVFIPESLEVGTPINASYTYSSSISSPESNEPPYADDVTINSEINVGSPIVATMTGVVIPNGQAEGLHSYAWYRAVDKFGTNEELITTTSVNQYVLQEADDAHYIRVKVTPTQVGGANLTGWAVSSPWSERINSATFNPYYDIEWASAYIPQDLVNFNTTNQWPNRGYEGPIAQDGTSALPSYDAGQSALRFESANTERVVIPKDYDTYPIEFWCRFKFAVDPTGNMNLFGFNNSTFIRVTSGNNFQISGASLSTTITDNVWYTARIVFNGINSTIELNKTNSVEIFTADATSLGGSGNGRIGCSFNQSSFFDGWISHIFVRKEELTPTEVSNMWTWFGFSASENIPINTQGFTITTPALTIAQPDAVALNTQSFTINTPSLSIVDNTIFLSTQGFTINTPTLDVDSASSELVLEFDSYMSEGSPIDVLVQIPPDLEPGQKYPMAIFYPGDGGNGSVTRVRGQVMGTGNGSQTTFTDNFSNGSEDVLYRSVKVYVNDVLRAIGNASGGWDGTGVSGSFNRTATNGSISITFSTPVPNGEDVTVDYDHCDIITDGGAALYVNAGDVIPGMVFYAVTRTTTESDLERHYDDLVRWARDEGHPIDLDRIIVTGLSRGAFQCRRIQQNRYQHNNTGNPATQTYGIAAVLYVANNIGTGWTWLNYSNIGGWWHCGTADGTTTYACGSVLNNQSGLAMNIPQETTGYFGLGHVAALWNTQVYNRRDRVGGTGTAAFDWVEWAKAYSQNQDQRAELHVERCEASLHLNDYRRALGQVNALSAGALKTELLGRLADVKADNFPTVYTLDIGTVAEVSAGNINNITSMGAGASISNLISDEGDVSGIGFSVVNQLTTSGTKVNAQSRCDIPFKGLPATFNTDGAPVITAISNGQVQFTSVPNGNYKVFIHPFSGNSTAVNAILEVTIGGVTKSRNAEHNSYYCIEFDVTVSSGTITIDLDATTSDTRITGIDLIQL